MKKLQYKFEAICLRFILALLEALRADYASTLSGLFFRFIGPLLPVSRVAYRNLELAMPDLDSTKRKHIVRDMWENLGRNLGELPHLATLKENTPQGPGFEIQGGHYLRPLLEKNSSVLFISGHIGNWELLPVAIARYGLSFASFYRAANNPDVNQIIIEMRNKALGTKVMPFFTKSMRGMFSAITHVIQGGRLGILVDQKMNNGIEASFFGHSAMTTPAAAIIALQYHCPVILGYVKRLGPARLRVVVEAPLLLPDTGDKQEDIRLLTQIFNNHLEVWIRQHPESWLWLHKRWPKDYYK
ncbi:MAG: lysophospholipid acyltransferase family protein [Acetobacter sp.]|nr:lysophospholipid acyltransferase family protein [Acetobacter sp.]